LVTYFILLFGIFPKGGLLHPVRENDQNPDTMNNKLSYEAPEVELFFVKIEGNILVGSPTGESFGSQTGNDNSEDWE